jgi:hypothetical protein
LGISAHLRIERPPKRSFPDRCPAALVLNLAAVESHRRIVAE